MISTVAEDADSRLVYSYNKVVNGFAAKLSDDEVQAMEKHPLFIRAIPADKPYKLTTTHSPDFLHLRGSNGLWKKTKNMGEGIIVGILDTGVTPGHPSFHDTGMPPPPKKWKGHCDFNKTVCNNKLIGAKSFLKAGAEELKHVPPNDVLGHGTHTASTAVGASVKNVSFLGIPMGEASGIAPRAHLAVYKVCSDISCEVPDVVKGIEAAVNDGCDVISISLGLSGAFTGYYNDPIALGGFYAILKGVFISTCAGNEGPNPSTILNDAPWLLTVAASTTDRQIRSTVKLGNELEFNGQTLYQPKTWNSTMLPLVYPAGSGPKANASKCVNGTLDNKQVGGKIVLCDLGVNHPLEKVMVVSEAGAAGIILVTQEDNPGSTNDNILPLPASHITYADGVKIKDYIRSTKQPAATLIFKGLVFNTSSPAIAAFSSRGPGNESALIIKPDIAGPGVSILAGVPALKLPIIFNFFSGTSMATPHLSGIAAIIKKEHPNWSPAAIRSAIMTTADTTGIDGKQIVDYTGYKDIDVNAIIYPAPPVQCAKVKAIPEEQLNYPSIAASLQKNDTVTINRTVTYVGEAHAKYEAVMSVPKGTSMEVVPSTLIFKSLNEKQTFMVIFKRLGEGPKLTMGELKWVSSKHVVRSPIAIST
ncbi:hypothetical protein LUZ63_000534 [Rhynchospora breviuscula]|uniref:Uncharacterized protein n=1 Tax=Rhynchospora breviuscula TaxID=2022672 RepID=A0A9Q0HWR2_9POAL|nr:hypothetical protein LUZ63_000534 [Rhynchospora breviuscula]